ASSGARGAQGARRALREDLARPLGWPRAAPLEPDPDALRPPARDFGRELVEAPGETRNFLGLQRDLGGGGDARRGAGGARDEGELDDLAPGETLAQGRLIDRLVGRLVE